MPLKPLRVFLALVFFSAILFFFLDFTGFTTHRWQWLTDCQLVPAIEAGSAAVLVFWLIATLLLGRSYCSIVCPLGVLQDIVAWFAKRVHRKKRYQFQKPYTRLRYTLLGLVLFGLLIGFPTFLTLLDPYGIFGRFANSTFRPLYLWANNLLASLPKSYENYGLYQVSIVWAIAASLFATLIFVGIAYLAYRFGRRYCNTVCPIGTLLGILSKYSLIKIRINENCISCKLCEFKCKGECIDAKSQLVDHSRCVACYNCLSVCKKKAIAYQISPSVLSRFTQTPKENLPVVKHELIELSPDERRLFLLTLLGMFISSSLGAASSETTLSGKSRIGYKISHPVMPPGARNIRRFQNRCTACHLCVSKCPANIITPAIGQYGIRGFLQPVLSYEHGFCNYDCTICADVCPNNALEQLEVQEKHLLQIGKVVFLKENCIVHTQGTSCGACEEHCTPKALKMVPYEHPEHPGVVLTIPTIDTEICIGCGACEYICPVRPFRAVYVDGHAKHQTAKPVAPPDAKNEEVDLDSFGF